MSVSPQDSQDVTLASADPDLLSCWERKVKQGRECSFLLEYRNEKNHFNPLANGERCNTSLSVSDSLVKPDRVSDQQLYDLFVVTGESGLCE